ncbi:MAG TPA: hypothetical protein VMV13_02660 [Candidatus Binataceae bacterium]|nr:hypothetical protein [Candidatus Binataceae bacterium]
MPRFLKYTWRTLATAGGAAMLLIAMPATGNAQVQQTPINICITARGFISGINVLCRSNEIGLEWNLPGTQGPQGAAGDQGPQGVTGAPGVVGAQGAVGPAGATGAAGTTGLTGLTGATGPVGLVGAAGAQGATGLAGPQGVTGAVGNQGPVGAIGPTGPTGIVGPTGPIGLQGAQGPQGAQGATGPVGPQGIQGVAGDNTSILSGGNLGQTIGAARAIQFSANRDVTPLYLGPGDGASNSSQSSVSVPVPAGTLSNLNVALDHAPGSSANPTYGYTITVCDNAACSGPTCQILGVSTACIATGTQTYATGDAMTLEVTSVTGLETTANATWSANYLITAP